MSDTLNHPPSAEASDRMAEELNQAWLSSYGESKRDVDSTFSYTVSLVNVPSISPPGALTQKAVSDLTETFHIARGLDLTDHKSRKICAITLGSTFAAATPSVTLVQIDENNSLLARELRDQHKSYWHAPALLVGPGTKIRVVLADVTGVDRPENELLRKSEYLAVLRLLMRSAKDRHQSPEYSILSVRQTHARWVVFRRDEYNVVVCISKWLHLADPSDLATLHYCLSNDWYEWPVPGKGLWSRIGDWLSDYSVTPDTV